MWENLGFVKDDKNVEVFQFVISFIKIKKTNYQIYNLFLMYCKTIIEMGQQNPLKQLVCG